MLAKQNGLDTLLMCLNAYKRRDPAGGDDEVEFMENLFDALCSALMEKENKVEFKAAEGFELMIMMIKYASESEEGKVGKGKYNGKV